MKNNIQNVTMEFSSFRKKQQCIEISALRDTLKWINRRIFQGEDLEEDRLRIIAHLDQEHSKIYFE